MIPVDRHGTIEVFRPDGPLKSGLLSELSESVDKSIVQGRPSILIDLADVILLDSAALEWLLEVDRRCALRGGNLVLVGGSELICEILHLTGVGKRLLWFDDLAQAMESCI